MTSPDSLPSMPSIMDITPIGDSSSNTIVTLEPPPGYKFGDSFLSIVPVDGGKGQGSAVEKMITARDQAVAVLRTQKDPIPAQMMDLPNRFCLTAADFGITGDAREVATLALAGDQEAWRMASRALIIFVLLMDEDKVQRDFVGPNGLPHRTLLGTSPDSGRPIYSAVRKYMASRWDIDAYSGMGVKSGVAPMPGFYKELAVASWLTHILPNIVFAKRGGELSGIGITEHARKRADERLNPDTSIKRKRALAWLVEANKRVEAKFPKNALNPKGGK